MHDLSSPKIIIISLILIVITTFFLQTGSIGTSNDFRSKAAGTGRTLTVCESGCIYAGATGLQQAADAAVDGDTIFITKGKYSGDIKTDCFLNLGPKKLTLKGDGDPRGEFNGSVLFGEGHDKAFVYTNRFGICSAGGEVVIDSLHIKEFQGGGLKFSGGSLILKNSIIDGNDSGGLHLNNTSLLAVNNYFVANIGIQSAGQANIKAYNNTFYNSKAFNTNCNTTVPPMDFVNNIVVDDELTIGAGWIYGDCPATAAQFKTKHIAYNLLWKNNHPCYESHEYCDNFTGKINADPLLDVAANDQRGWRGWGGNFSLKEGSPAIGKGDPSVPGSIDLGAASGPCVNPNSSTCTGFIQANLPVVNNSPPADNNGSGGGNGGGGGGGHIPPTVTGFYPEPSFAWPTAVDDNGQAPTSPPDGGVNNNPTQPPNSGGNGRINNPNGNNPDTGNNSNPPITYYFPPTGSLNNQSGNNSPNPSPQTSIKPTPKLFIDIDKTVKDTKTVISNFVETLTKLSKMIMP